MANISSSMTSPEYALGSIFKKARETAPCFLVFEDLDSVVTDRVRSYFLNQVDGIASNDGILMIGSTNHLELLDPGISKRPSRFDRKYLFPNPNFAERVLYAQFWRRKLLGDAKIFEEEQEFDLNQLKIEFPEQMCKSVAEITDKFSFAYIQEAFVAALLVIVAEEAKPEQGDFVMVDHELEGSTCGEEPVILTSEDGDMDKVVLWEEFKKQVKILRDQLDDGDGSE